MSFTVKTPAYFSLSPIDGNRHIVETSSDGGNVFYRFPADTLPASSIWLPESHRRLPTGAYSIVIERECLFVDFRDPHDNVTAFLFAIRRLLQEAKAGQVPEDDGRRPSLWFGVEIVGIFETVADRYDASIDRVDQLLQLFENGLLTFSPPFVRQAGEISYDPRTYPEPEMF